MPFDGFRELVPLARYTTFRIGGPAALLAEVSTAEEVVEAAANAGKMGVLWQVIGHGSNILAGDGTIDKAVIVFKDKTPPKILPDGQVEVSAGCPLSYLVDFLAYKGRGGLECLAGIPGTVGGAVAGNAGAYGTTIGERVVSATILNRNGNVRTIPAKDFSFDYRHSMIKETGDVILKVIFKTYAEDSHILRAILVGKLIDRRLKHPDPMFVPTAGSFFKNPKGKDGNRTAAGKMLEEAGCKELRVRGAYPWPRHANIIITDGKASANDVKMLAQEMARRVEDKFGARLSPEVCYLG